MINDGYGEGLTRDQLLSQAFVDMKRWLYWEARQQTSETHRHDDLVQEAYIAMWRVVDRAFDESRGDPLAFLREVARIRMKACLDESRWTGHTDPEQPKTQTKFAKRGGDETRAKIRAYIADYRAEHSEEPTQNQIARGLGMNSGNVNRHLKRMHMTADHRRGGTQDANRIRTTSLDAVVEQTGDAEFVAVSGQVLDQIELAYHYGEIHEAVADLTEVYREYVYLRFWCGLTSVEISELQGRAVSSIWTKNIRPVLAERLSHLVDV